MTVGEQAASAWSVHAGHLLLLGAWAVCFGAAWGWSVLRRRRIAAPVAPVEAGATVLARGPWLWAAAAACVASGAIHLAVTPEHFEEAALYGWFFLVLTAAQFAWSAWILWRPGRAVLLAGAASSALVVLLWIATRTVGIPVGPGAGETEPFGAADIVASAAEAVVVLASLVAVATGRACEAGRRDVARRSARRSLRRPRAA